MVQAAESPKITPDNAVPIDGVVVASDGTTQTSSTRKSSTPPASPGSSGGRRGRSRTRSIPGVGVHSHLTDEDAEGNTERQ